MKKKLIIVKNFTNRVKHIRLQKYIVYQHYNETPSIIFKMICPITKRKYQQNFSLPLLGYHTAYEYARIDYQRCMCRIECGLPLHYE